MAQYELSGQGVAAGAPFAEQVREFSSRYSGLLGRLASIGTEVERDRTLERDPDIAPYRFVRGARHVFVFPPQAVELSDREGVEVGVLPGTEPYTLTMESQVADHDESLVEGRVTVFYDDAGDLPQLQITDQLEDGSESRLPVEAQLAIESAIEPVSTTAS